MGFTAAAAAAAAAIVAVPASSPWLCSGILFLRMSLFCGLLLLFVVGAGFWFSSRKDSGGNVQCLVRHGADDSLL